MIFIETRGNDGVCLKEVSFSHAILNPIASFGGLYVAKNLPVFTQDELKGLKNLKYQFLAKSILKSLDLDIDEVTINKALERYNNFDVKNVVQMSAVDRDLFVCELWHGPTRAFKDMALQPFGSILSDLARKKQKKYLILTATSGDTGPATLSTFSGDENVYVACLYPHAKTSEIQRLQMTTVSAKNLRSIGVEGDFDDTQRALKSLLADDEFKEFLSKKKLSLSAANSVNFGRIVFQTIYYFYGYFELVRSKEITFGEKIDFLVPSGNFGNALGGYYAKKMGLPIDKIIIASNENDVLTDLFNNGKYDLRQRKLKSTISPAMDILKSSNVERLLFDKFGHVRTKELMLALDKGNYYALSKDEILALQEDFKSFSASQTQTLSNMKRFGDKKYIADPHTATCLGYTPNKKTIALSTAEWTKFPISVFDALCDEAISKDKEALGLLSKRYNQKIPPQIQELLDKEITQKTVVKKDEIKQAIKDFLDEI